MKKVIFIIVLLLAFGFWYSSNSYTTEPVINHISETVDDYIVPKEKCYHYSQLDESGKAVYDELLRQVPGGEMKFSIKGVPEEVRYGENFEIIIDAFYKDHPEFFWLCNGYEWSYYSFFNRMDIELCANEFWTDGFNKEKAVDKFFEKSDRIIAKAEKYDGEYEQIKFVHDYLIDNIEYDDEAAEAIDKDKRTVDVGYAYSGYGAIIKGLSVCEGYAKAFQFITQSLGYECILVSGEGAKEPHSWNMVKLDDEYYYFDITWDDAGDNVDEKGRLICADGNSHDYFAVTSKEFASEHKSSDFDYPLCTATEYNYFYREGYVAEEYSETLIKDILKKQYDEGLSEISIKFTEQKTMDKAYDYVEDQMERLMYSYRYYNRFENYYIHKNEKMNVITYYFV